MKCCLFYIYYWKNELYIFKFKLFICTIAMQLCNSRTGHVNVLLLLFITYIISYYYSVVSSFYAYIYNMTCFVYLCIFSCITTLILPGIIVHPQYSGITYTICWIYSVRLVKYKISNRYYFINILQS